MKIILTAMSILSTFVISSFSQLTECGYNVTPCEAYANADAVFIGKVTKIVPETSEIWQRDKDYDQTANIAIEKIYKGIEGNSVVLHQLGRKNAPKFISGGRYLFYANFDRATKKWGVKPCGRTRMGNYVQDDLRYLDGLPASVKRSRIAGEVVRYETDSENPQGTMERLAGIKVRIIGAGKEYETVTDENGFYEAYDIPAGRYVMQPKIPNGLVLMGVMHYGVLDHTKFRSLEIEVKEGVCSGATILLTTDRIIEKSTGSKIGKLSNANHVDEYIHAAPNNAMHPTALCLAVINLASCDVACVFSPGGG